MKDKDRIIAMLLSTKRTGINDMIDYLVKEGYFEAPASTKYHGCYKGGLASHSFEVYERLDGYASIFKLGEISAPGQKPLPIVSETIIIAALLHDVCKIGAYIGIEKPYKWNRQQPKGHALLSIERIKKFIKLSELEEMMIKYHMGVYGLNEFYSEDDWQSGEYPLRGDHAKDESMTKEESQKARYGQSMGNAWFHNPICKVMYFCDELATLQEKAKEI